MPPDHGVEIPGVDPRDKALATIGYDPHHPHYNLNGYIPRESLSDHTKSNDTKESVTDNFNKRRLLGMLIPPDHHEILLGRVLMDMHVNSMRCEMNS